MLRQLTIQNIALIDQVNIELGEGLNILTGETGAGKSLVIDSINAILGDRLSKDLIRTGEEKATVEAVFEVDNKAVNSYLEEVGISPEEDNTLIISREFTLSGRNTCRINGKMVTVSMLKEIGQLLIDVHGQHDNQSLLRTESHIHLLDSFGGEKIERLKREYIKLLNEYRQLTDKLKKLTGDEKERERKIDLYKFQIDEIAKAKLKTGEEEELEKQRLLLGNSEKIVNSLSRAYDLIYGGDSVKSSALDKINGALAEIRNISEYNEKYKEVEKRLEELSYQLDDLTEEVRHMRDSVEYDPSLLEEIEERIDLIFRLKRKYGSNIEEILKYKKEIEIELDEIIKSEEIINELNRKISEIEGKMYETARMLNAERQKAAHILEMKIGNELDELDMKKAQFKVSIEFDKEGSEGGKRNYLNDGLDRVEFLISPNMGEPLKALAKIASGGEMARVMLAIKNILADVDEVPTLIFDEIDTGISGKAAQKVAEKLCLISRKHQVICVTHLPQIACMADRHFLIEKNYKNNSTVTKVELLKKDAIKHEIARILSGDNISGITIKHAEEMLSNAKQYKMAN